MCGIVGIVGDLDHKDKDVFEQMLVVCQLRGMDSAGVFSVPADAKAPEPIIAKTVGTPIDLFNYAPYAKATSLWNKSAVIGHCRKATVGAVNRFTAHPFNSQHLTGVHNGTLRNWRSLPGESLATDSATLYDVMARLGVRDTIEQTDGAYALVWYDEEQRTVNFLRNRERPLFWALNKDRTKMYFASEAWMITAITNRNGIELADLTPDADTYRYVDEFPVDVHVRTSVGGKGKDALRFHDNEELKGDVKKPISATNFHGSRPVGFVPHPWAEGSGTVSDYERSLLRPRVPQVTTPAPAASGTTAPSTSSSATPTVTSTSKDGPPRRPLLTLAADNKNVGSGSSTTASRADDHPVPTDSQSNDCFDNELIGNNGLVLTKGEFEELVDPNCIWCQTPHTFEELKEGSALGNWIDDDQYICSGCLTVTRREGIM